jgi:hypothetical protein
MENRKDIGKVFSEKLNNFEKEPNDSVWNSIHAELQKKKKRKIIYIPFWMKTAGVLSLLTLISIFSIDAFLEKEQFSAPNKSNQEILNSKSFEKSNPKKGKAVNTESLTLTDSSNNLISNRKNRQTSSNKGNWKNNKKKLNAKKGLTESKNNLVLTDDSNKKVFENNPLSDVENNNAKTETNSEKSDSLKLTKEDKPELKIALEEKKDSLSDKKSGLYVFAYGSPTYSGMLSKNSPLDNRLTNNPKSTEMNWSYGVYLGYESDYKWSLRLGIGKMNMSFITENAAANTADYRNINYSKNTTNATIYTDTNFSETMTITQDISYTEIPLEVKYNFYDKKFGISSIVGFSYLFVDENVISIKTANGSNFDIGSTKNLSENTFTINAGFEMYYNLSKKLKFNVEPLFKYHPIDYKNNSNPVNPYSFGIQTGLQFSFSK